MERILFVIPARLESTRLARKMLLKLRGDKSVLQCTWERVLRSQALATKNSKLIIATDSLEIKDEAKRFGADCMMTSPLCRSGSERAGEVLAALQQSSGQTFDVVVNVQGDEPFLDPEHLDVIVNGLITNDWADASTAAVRVVEAPSFPVPPNNDPSKVKVVLAQNGSALYFSRAPIPYGTPAQSWLRHIGVYAFRPQTLESFVRAKPTPLEQRENLEQLRLLELGYKMHVSTVDTCEFAGIDTRLDYEQALARVRGMAQH